MNFKYYYPKKDFNQTDVSQLYVFFKNGDFFQIRKNEIIKVNVNLYDNLIWYDFYASPVAESGYIKLRIQEGKAKGESRRLFNEKEYIKNRKAYIQKRLVTDGLIDRICIFDEHGSHQLLFGDACAEDEGDYIIIKYNPNSAYGSCSQENNIIELRNIKKSDIYKIHLVFENCEAFDIFGDEIIDMQLNFHNKLCSDGSGYSRAVKNGYIKLKLDKDNSTRYINLATEWLGKKTVGLAPLYQRLYGRKGKAVIDICYLDIYFNYRASGLKCDESLILHDIRTEEHVGEPENEEFYNSFHISGYAEKQNDGSALIVLGKKIPN